MRATDITKGMAVVIYDIVDTQVYTADYVEGSKVHLTYEVAGLGSLDKGMMDVSILHAASKVQLWNHSQLHI